MKKNILLFVLTGIITSSCIECELTYTTLNIMGRMSWSSDLLEFITPIFAFTDATGSHEIVVTDDMITEKELSYIEGGEEIYLGSIRTCEFNLECAYNYKDTIYATIQYRIKDDISINLDTIYEFDHTLSINRIGIGDNFSTFISINIGGEEEKIIEGINAEEYINDLTVSSDKKRIYITEEMKIIVE